MKITERTIRTAYLLGASSLALLLVGCADSAAPPTAKTAPTTPRSTVTAPGATATAPTPKLDLSKRPDFDATVATVVTYRDGAGKIQQKKFSQRVRASFKRGSGIARASLELASADDAGRMFASITDGAATFAQYTSDATTLTPVLAATSGTLAYDYQDSQTDSVGNVFEIYGWAPTAETPITDAWGYRNGVLIGQYHADWTAVSGGYVLARQILGSYQPDGATLAGTVASTVTPSGGGGGSDPGIMMMKNESFGERLRSFPRLALEKVGCWLAPQVAFASIQCWRTGLVFGGTTWGLAAATYSGAAFAAPGLYFAGWGLWTESMIGFLECIDSSGRRIGRGGGRCSVNPRSAGCGGGGGGGYPF